MTHFPLSNPHSFLDKINDVMTRIPQTAQKFLVTLLALLIRTPAVIDDFDQNVSRIKIYRKYYSDFTHANSITARPFSSGLFQVDRNIFAHELLDRFAHRFNRKVIGKMIVNKEFFRLSRKKEMPVHEYLYSYAYGAHSFSRRLFVKLFDIFLLLMRHGGKQGSAETHHLGSENLAHACACKFLYFAFKCRSHWGSIANRNFSSIDLYQTQLHVLLQ